METDYMNEIEDQIKQADDTWEIFTLADAFKPRRPLQFVIGGLFTLPSLSIVYGAPGTLKSMVLADAITHVAAGVDWLGRPVIQSPVLWIDFDNGKRRTHERFEALARQINLSADSPFYYVSLPNPPLDAGNAADIEALERRIKSLGAQFVVIDNLGLVSPGTDENSDGMIKVMGNLRALAERTGAAIVLIHHQRKTTKANGNARSGESLRGHTSIESALDLALLVEREERSDIVTIRSTKSRDTQVFPFAAEWRYAHKPGTSELESAGFMEFHVDDNSADAALENAIIEIVKSSALINQTKLIETVTKLSGAGKNKAFEMIHKLEKNQVLKVNPGKKGGKLYFID